MILPILTQAQAFDTQTYVYGGKYYNMTPSEWAAFLRAQPPVRGATPEEIAEFQRQARIEGQKFIESERLQAAKMGLKPPPVEVAGGVAKDTESILSRSLQWGSKVLPWAGKTLRFGGPPAVVGGTLYTGYEYYDASKGVSFTIGGRAESACQLIGFARDTEDFTKCANSIADQLNKGISPADVMLPKDLKVPSQTSSVATTPVATPAAAPTATAPPVAAPVAGQAAPARAATQTAANVSNYQKAIELCDKKGLKSEEAITKCQIDTEKRLNVGKLPATRPVNTSGIVDNNYQKAVKYCDTQGLKTEEDITQCQIDAEKRFNAGTSAAVRQQIESPTYQWYGSPEKCTDWYPDDQRLFDNCVKGGSQGKTFSTISSQGWQAQLDACGPDSSCQDGVINRMNSNALKQQDDRIKAKNDADYARRLDVYCKGDSECIQREMEAQDDQGVQGAFLPDASREAAKLQESQQKALESGVVPPGYWDPKGPYPRGAEDMYVRPEDTPRNFTQGSFLSDVSKFFSNLFGGGGTETKAPAIQRSSAPAYSSPFPPDADNLWTAPAGPSESFIRRWFGGGQAETWQAPASSRTEKYLEQYQWETAEDINEAETGRFNLSEYNAMQTEPVIEVPLESPDVWLKNRPQLVPDDLDTYRNTEPTGSTQQISGPFDYAPAEIEASDQSSYTGPHGQYSVAVPFSNELFNQSLAASAFGAFLLKDKEDNIPARGAREPYGHGL